jgi:hypothetical protein
VPEDDGAEAELSKDDAEREAKQAFEDVLSWGSKLEVDHHLVFHARPCFRFSLLHSCSLISRLRTWETTFLLGR